MAVIKILTSSGVPRSLQPNNRVFRLCRQIAPTRSQKTGVDFADWVYVMLVRRAYRHRARTGQYVFTCSHLLRCSHV